MDEEPLDRLKLFFFGYKIEFLLQSNLSVYVCEAPSQRLEPCPLPPHTPQAFILVECPPHQGCTVVDQLKLEHTQTIYKYNIAHTHIYGIYVDTSYTYYTYGIFACKTLIKMSVAITNCTRNILQQFLLLPPPPPRATTQIPKLL